MEKVIVFSDSTCDLNTEIIKENNIQIIPLYVSFKEDIYKDGIELNPSLLYDMVTEKGYLPKTSAASYIDFFEAFKPYIDDGYKIVYVGIGSDFSATYNNAVMAAKDLGEDNILIIDSKNLSTSAGLLLLKIKKFIKEGSNLKEIEERINEYIPLIRCKFAIESLEYLHKGGRCSGVAKFFGTLLKLKPIIHVKDGKMDVFAKTKGKRKALELMIKDIVANKNKLDLEVVMITHTESEEEALFLHSRLSKEIKKIKKIIINEAGCVISSHCGAKSIGIIYTLKIKKK